MGKKRQSGVCRLTGTPGEFVASHIIPLALTRLSGTGEKRIEAGIGLGIKHRANSWYDNALVKGNGGSRLLKPTRPLAIATHANA
jgi:hypothetical protein